MTRFILGSGALLLVALVPVAAQELPAPDWLDKYVDQGEHDPRLKGYRTPAGIKVEMVAEIGANPLALTFGPDGALYVLLKDRITVGREEQGKWHFGEAKLAFEGGIPSNLFFHAGYLFTASQGTVRRFQPQAPAGSPVIIARGFHAVTGLAAGNDGSLYITAGAGDHHVEGSDGSRAVTLRTGAIFRCRPDGSKLEVYSIGYANPFGGAFDAAFNFFLADDPGSSRSQLLHTAEGADFGWRQASPCAADPAFPNERPGTAPTVLKTGRIVPSGLVSYNDTRLPEQYRGLLYYPAPTERVVRACLLKQKGASFEVTHAFDLLKSDDRFFQPWQLVGGPDGALYLCDRRTEDGQARLYRVSWSGTEEQPAIARGSLDRGAQIRKQADEDLLKTLESDDFSDRRAAQCELVHRGDKNRTALVSLLKDFNQATPARIAALGALQAFWNDDVKAGCIDALGSSQPELRRLAADALTLCGARADRTIHEALEQNLNDDDLLVRRSVFLAIGKIAAPAAGDVLVSALQFDESKDTYLRDGLARALEAVGKPGIDRLFTLADSGAGKDLDRVLEVYPTFRTRAAAEALPKLLRHYHVKPQQKVALLQSYENYQLEPAVSLQPLAQYLDEISRPGGNEKMVRALLPVKRVALHVLVCHGMLEPEVVRQALAETLVPGTLLPLP